MPGCATTNTGPQPPYQQTQKPAPRPVVTPRPRPKPKDEAPAPVQTPTNTQPKPQDPRRGDVPAFLDPQTSIVALILPFSSPSEALREEANSMLRAAELAMFEREGADMLLLPLDSAGTADGARHAAEQAQAKGADIILGPILAASVKSAGRAASKTSTPVIGFSTDTSAAGRGVYLLSFPPEAEVTRVTAFAAEAGARKFAFLGPSSTYGRRVQAAYETQIQNYGGVLTGRESYDGNDITVMQDPARRIAEIYTKASEEAGEAQRTADNVAYHAILLPEGGTALRSLAPLLTYYDENINGANVQFMGTSRWYNDEVVREPALNGGIFAAPDFDARRAFTAQYDARYGEEPSRLATLAYDAVNIGAYAAASDPRQRKALLSDPAGFYGIDGLIRFAADGTPERGLAVYQVKNGRFVIIDPAPQSTDPTN